MAKIECSTSIFAASNSLWDFCDLTQSDNSMNELHLSLFISVRWLWVIGLRIAVKNKSVHCTIQYQYIRNETGFMVRKPPYSVKRLVNVYKVRLNVYKIKR